jgi:hypothetical protein
VPCAPAGVGLGDDLARAKLAQRRFNVGLGHRDRTDDLSDAKPSSGLEPLTLPYHQEAKAGGCGSFAAIARGAGFSRRLAGGCGSDPGG